MWKTRPRGCSCRACKRRWGWDKATPCLRTTTLTHAQAVTTTWHAYNEARAGSPSATAADTIHIHTTAASHTLYLPLVTR